MSLCAYEVDVKDRLLRLFRKTIDLDLQYFVFLTPYIYDRFDCLAKRHDLNPQLSIELSNMSETAEVVCTHFVEEPGMMLVICLGKSAVPLVTTAPLLLETRHAKYHISVILCW